MKFVMTAELLLSGKADEKAVERAIEDAKPLLTKGAPEGKGAVIDSYSVKGDTMLFARVVGNVVCTRKDEKLVGRKLLLVEPTDMQGGRKGPPLVAVDSVGAGEGELVLTAMSTIPSREMWLFKNKKALESVLVGIKDAQEGRIAEFDPDDEEA